tara:strand:+ start:20 stop:289 length:270 start_codon:yes stop_codon:yes gene_type:complete
MSDSDEEFEHQHRAEQIAKSCFEVGRGLEDTAGMDTDDEVWIDEHPDYIYYIKQVEQDLKDIEIRKKQEAAIMIQKYTRRLINKKFEIN